MNSVYAVSDDVRLLFVTDKVKKAIDFICEKLKFMRCSEVYWPSYPEEIKVGDFIQVQGIFYLKEEQSITIREVHNFFIDHMEIK